jgi:hypothetical protein
MNIQKNVFIMNNTDTKFYLSEDEIVKIINTSILSSSCRGCTLNLLYLGSQDLMLMSDEKQNVYPNQDFHLL